MISLGDILIRQKALRAGRLRQTIPVERDCADNNQTFDDILPDVGYAGKDEPIG